MYPYSSWSIGKKLCKAAAKMMQGSSHLRFHGLDGKVEDVRNLSVCEAVSPAHQKDLAPPLGQLLNRSVDGILHLLLTDDRIRMLRIDVVQLGRRDEPPPDAHGSEVVETPIPDRSEDVRSQRILSGFVPMQPELQERRLNNLFGVRL